jgi:hypothetical protein
MEFPDSSLINATEQFYIQLVAEVFFIPFLLQEVFIGRFYWRLSFVSVLVHAIGMYAVVGFFQTVLAKAIPIEVGLSMTMYISSLILLYRIMYRVKSYIRDYRFWSIMGVAVYYLAANFVFFIGWTSRSYTDVWWIQQVAFAFSMVCFSASMIYWHINRDVILDISERFLLPNWMLRKLLYFFEDLPEEIPGHL